MIPISIRELLHILSRYKWVLLAMAVLGVAAALVFGLTSTPVYQATAVLQIDRATQRVVQFAKDIDPFQESDTLILQTQYELLRSRSLAERVVDDLHLDAPSGQGAGVAPGAPVSAAVPVAVGAASAPQGGWWDSIVAGYDRLGKPSVNDRAVLGREEVLRRFAKALTVEPVRNSRLVKVKFKDANAAHAARVDQCHCADLHYPGHGAAHAVVGLRQVVSGRPDQGHQGQAGIVRARAQRLRQRQLAVDAGRENQRHQPDLHRVFGGHCRRPSRSA